jgi:hypothetical protein
LTPTPIPHPDDRRLSLIREDADRGRVEREQPPGAGLQPEPTRGEHAQDVPNCEDQGVSGGGTKLGDHSIDTLPDLRGSLAVRDAVAPERPARALPSDVDRRPS